MISRLDFRAWKEADPKKALLITQETIEKAVKIARLNSEDRRRREVWNLGDFVLPFLPSNEVCLCVIIEADISFTFFIPQSRSTSLKANSNAVPGPRLVTTLSIDTTPSSEYL
ncbi:hypothetical protein AB6A40_003159 [Gnathostoma spinigerum]|uniref:Uncharacterized protein n=1 Tax=Gnathostoma spinigerum TaxID=75299 RepID=A0ABD6E9X1_9BILA